MIGGAREGAASRFRLRLRFRFRFRFRLRRGAVVFSLRLARIASLVVAVVLLGPAPLRAETPGAIPFSGVILQRGDRVPIPGVSVLLDAGALSALTDGEGRFVFPSVPPGPHVVHLRGEVTGALDLPITLAPGKRTTVTYWLEKREKFAVTVRGRRAVQETAVQTLGAEEMKRIPGTQGDPVKAVQNLPGVARPPFNGGLLVVWGSAPGDTRTYVDGVYIPTLFHYSGLRSTVNSDVVSSLTFLPGGYGVDYGRGLGGAIEIESRRPRSDGWHGFAQVDLIDVSAMVEGPITRTLSVAVAGRVSWLHLFLPALVGSDVQAEPRYWDYQARLHWRPTARDDVDLFFFGSDDQLHLLLKDPDPTEEKAIEHHVYYHRGLARWQHRFDGGATLTITPSLGYDLPDHRSFAYGNQPFSIANGQLEYNLRAVARVPVVPSLRVDFGIDYEGTRFTLDASQNAGGLLREGDNGGFGGLGGPDTTQGVASDHLVLFTNHVAPFAVLALSLLDGRLAVSGQLRLEVMTFDGRSGRPEEHFRRTDVLPEPRLALRWQVHPRLGLRAALGVYHQAPASGDFSTVFGSARLGPAVGFHGVLGLDAQVTPTLHVEAQGFYKDLRDLVVRGATVGDEPLANGGIGRVYGGELLVRQQLWRGLFGWLSYTVSRSERRDHPGDPFRPFQYDQTHILTLLASYKLPFGLHVGLRFRYATGNPYTPAVRSFYDVHSDGYLPIWGPTYSARMPSFHQLDLRIDKTFTFNRWRFLAYLDLQNLYAAKSAEAALFNYDFSKVAFVTGLPFLPVLGVRGEF